MSTVFLRLFLSNPGVARFILLVLLYWVWIWWLDKTLLYPVICLMKATVFLLVLALGHNSFSYAYVTMSRFPFSWPCIFAMAGWRCSHLSCLALFRCSVSIICGSTCTLPVIHQHCIPGRLRFSFQPGIPGDSRDSCASGSNKCHRVLGDTLSGHVGTGTVTLESASRHDCVLVSYQIH
jgi:hypothetical protein